MRPDLNLIRAVDQRFYTYLINIIDERIKCLKKRSTRAKYGVTAQFYKERASELRSFKKYIILCKEC